MQVTLIGLVVFLVGMWLLLASSIEAMLSFVIICTLMNGSAAFVLSALGNSSIPPAHLSLAFLIARIVFSREEWKQLSLSVKHNIFFVLFGIYAVISAIALPRLFSNMINVVPMRPGGLLFLYDTFPLKPSSQNVTAPVYIMGSVIFSIFTFVAIRRLTGAVRLVKTAIVVTWIHVLTGLANLLLPASVWNLVSIVFRNGSYAQLDQEVGNFKRISGILPEPSAYAAYGFCWFVFMTELWIRRIMPRQTGFAALAMAVLLVLTLSSTGYVGLGAYFLFLVVRMAIFPSGFSFRTVSRLFLLGLFVFSALSAVVLVRPRTAELLTNTLSHFTVEKGESASGKQRAFWARQGFDAFKVSYGLGIGAGSFRSSSLLTAVLGSMGVIGVVTFLAHLWKVWRPDQESSFKNPYDQTDAVGIAASWTAFFVIVVASVAAASPDPGILFALFAAIALALRVISSKKPASSSNGKLTFGTIVGALQGRRNVHLR
jgi:hypothetical protein